MSVIGNPTRRPDFSGAVLKVEHAKCHIADFDAEAGRFFAKHPHQVTLQPYLKGERYGYGIYQRMTFPAGNLALLIGDAVHNLRAALDYLISACARANGRTINDTHFPIVRRASDLGPALKDKVRKAGPTAMQLVRNAKPYSRGNRALRAIHDLDMTDKHRLIVPIACTARITISTGHWNDLPHIDLTGTVISTGNQVQFVAVPEGYEAALYNEANFSGDIVFARKAPLGGKPCVEALYGLAEAVTRIIATFEDAFGCTRLSSRLFHHVAPVTSDI